MDRVSVKLQVLFQDPFWIGLCERVEEGKLSACKITFGTEPKEYELLDYVLQYWNELKFSPTVETAEKDVTAMNPKRRQRMVKKQIGVTGIGTKSQQALKLLQEEGKQSRRIRTRLQKQAEQERLFAIHQQKKKEKHKGR